MATHYSTTKIEGIAIPSPMENIKRLSQPPSPLSQLIQTERRESNDSLRSGTPKQSVFERIFRGLRETMGIATLLPHPKEMTPL